MAQRMVTRVLGSKELKLDGLHSLRKGDVFRMYEPDTLEPVVNEMNGSTTFKAKSEPYFSDTYGAWMIDIEDDRLH